MAGTAKSNPPAVGHYHVERYKNTNTWLLIDGRTGVNCGRMGTKAYTLEVAAKWYAQDVARLAAWNNQTPEEQAEFWRTHNPD